MAQTSKRLASCEDVQSLSVPKIGDDTGSLTIFDRKDLVPFDIARVFVVRTDANQQRGRHAHRECQQFLNCANGACEVVCDDGDRKLSFRLDQTTPGLLIPPGIWAEQTYLEPATVLVVLCSHSYSESDYIRDYDEFLQFRKQL